MNRFKEFYANFLSNFLQPNKPLKIVVDCSNGAVGFIAGHIFKNDNILTFKIVNQKLSGNFPAHGPDPLKGNAFKKLKQAVLQEKADLGIVFDADGDRAFFTDNQGRKADPDAITRLLIWHLRPKRVVIDVRTGWLVTQFKIENLKFKIFTSKVGRYFVQKLMKKQGVDLGAEHSGHYYFKKFYFFDSGVLAAIEVINAVSKLPYSLADFIDLLPPHYSTETNLIINRRKNYLPVLKNIQNKYKKFAKSISRLDGLKMEMTSASGSWWFNIHFSNTEPLIRLTIEAESSKILAIEHKNLLNLLRL